MTQDVEFRLIPFKFWVPDVDCPGAAKQVSDKEEIKALSELGVPFYGTLAGCVLYSGVQASAFDSALYVEKLWNGADIVKNNWSVAGIPHSSIRSVYTVVATPGMTHPHVPPKKMLNQPIISINNNHISC